MIHVCYSNSLEALVEALVADRQRVRSNLEENLFAIDSVVVPNSYMGAYLKLQVAAQQGVCCGIVCTDFMKFLRGCLPSRLRLLDRSVLQSLLCSLLASSALTNEPELEPVRTYLHGAGMEEAELAKRQFQLAKTLARLFLEYDAFRPALLQRWLAETTAPMTTEEGETEGWQRGVWRHLWQPGMVFDRIATTTGCQWKTVSMLAQMDSLEDWHLPPRVYIFAFPFLSPAYHHILQRLQYRTDIHIYAINPCREFWEDLDGAESDALGLRFWGGQAKQQIRMLNHMCRYDFQDRFSLPTGTTLLAQVQTDILTRANISSRPDDTPPCSDGSIRIFACSDVRRELEVVGEEIWHLVKEDDSLRFNDIAVWINPSTASVYTAQLPAVFREVESIPYHLVDIPVVDNVRIVEALRLILELPFGRYTRRDLLEIMTHPAVVGRFEQVYAREWIAWSERLGIVRGVDRNDHLGTYIERDLFHWDQGLKRLALGAFMSGEDVGQGPLEKIDFGGTSYVPHSLEGGELASAARFITLARSLIADARYCQSASLPLSEWGKLFVTLAKTYLHPQSEEEARHVNRCCDAMSSLLDIDVDGRPVSYRIAYEFAKQTLERLHFTRGEFLADGVMVAPMSAVGSIPFRVVFALGLDEGAFPRLDGNNPLDLARRQRQSTEVSLRDRDRNAFLETILSAKERAYFSYVARDSHSGEVRPPSGPIAELGYLLALGYGYREREGSDAIRKVHPLRSYDRCYFPQLYSEEQPTPPRSSVSLSARKQAQAVALREHLCAHLRANDVTIPAAHVLEAHMQQMADHSVGSILSSLQLSSREAIEKTVDSPIPLPFAALRRFLETPLQAWATFVLGLRDGSVDDWMTREDEPVRGSPLMVAQTLRDLFTEYLTTSGDRDWGSLVSAYEQRADLLEWTSTVPTGVFGQHERERQRSILARWNYHLEEMGIARQQVWSRVRVGSVRSPGEGVRVDPLSLRIRQGEHIASEVSVEISGSTDLLGGKEVGSLVLVPSEVISPRHILRGVMDQLVLSAAGLAAGQEHFITIVTGGKRLERYRLAPWSQHEASQYLCELVTDMLTKNHDYLLPCEAVFLHKDKPQRSIEETIHQLVRRRFGVSCLYGPVPHPERFSIPEDVEVLVCERFQPIWTRLASVEESGA